MAGWWGRGRVRWAVHLVREPLKRLAAQQGKWCNFSNARSARLPLLLRVTLSNVLQVITDRVLPTAAWVCVCFFFFLPDSLSSLWGTFLNAPDRV